MSHPLNARIDDLEGVRLLVLESSPSMARSIAGRLAGAGWHVECVGDLGTVVAMTSRQSWDAVVLGPTFLQTQDGLQIARRALPGVALVDVHPWSRMDNEAREVLDHLADPVLTFDLRAEERPGRPRLRWCNAAAEKWFGRPGTTLLSQPGLLWGHVHDEDVAPLAAWFDAPTTEPTVLRVRWVSATGEVHAADVLASARGGRKGAPAVADLILHDAAHEVALETAVATHRQQVRALVDRPDEVVFQMRLRPQLTVAWVNDAAPKLLGIEPLALRDDASRLFDAMSAEDADRVRAAMQSAVSAETSVRFTVRRANGPANIELTLRPLRGSTTMLLARGREVGAEVDGRAATADATATPERRTLAAVRSFAEAAAAAVAARPTGGPTFAPAPGQAEADDEAGRLPAPRDTAPTGALSRMIEVG